MHSLVSFWLFVRIGFLRNQIYKSAVVFKIVSSVIFLLVQWSLWRSIYASNAITVYDQDSILAYFVFSQLLYAMYPSSVSMQFGRQIQTGQISIRLLQPVNLLKQFLYESIGVSIHSLIMVVLPLTLFSLLARQLSGISGHNLLPFLLFVTNSFFIMFCFESLLGCLCFITRSHWGVQSLKQVILLLLSGRLIPLSLYPDSLEKIVRVLPFQFFYDVPISYLVHDTHSGFVHLYALQLFYLAMFIVAMVYAYRRSIRHLVVQGG